MVLHETQNTMPVSRNAPILDDKHKGSQGGTCSSINGVHTDAHVCTEKNTLKHGVKERQRQSTFPDKYTRVCAGAPGEREDEAAKREKAVATPTERVVAVRVSCFVMEKARCG